MTIASSADLRHGTPRFDVLIVGSGPAGIAVATAFLGTGHKVALVESGGLERAAAADALNDFETIGQSRAPYEEIGCRVFGGSSALWTGRCGAFDVMDFHARPWLARSGWPLDPDDLAPYLQRAAGFLGTGPALPAADARRELQQGFDDPPFDTALFQPVVWQFSRSGSDQPTAVRQFTPEGALPSTLLQHTGGTEAVNVAEKYGDALKASENIHVFTSATVISVLTDPETARVSGVRVVDRDGDLIKIEAGVVVLAGGAIQNPRLLLSTQSPNGTGLGNNYDQVGRYLADHHFSQIAVFEGARGAALRRRLGSRWHPQFGSARVYNLGLRLSENLQRRDALLNASLHLVEFGTRTHPLSQLAQGLRAATAGHIGQAAQNIVRSFLQPRGLALGVYDRLIAKRPSLNVPERTVLGCDVEQEVNPESRVTLSDRKDRFGQPLACIHWEISEREFRTVRAVEDAFRQEAMRLKLGAYQGPGWTDNDFDAWRGELVDLAHPACTTRMSSDPASGVVDANCKVHGVKGLYIAGSSVFATNSHMNPTQMIVALALRLADHVKSEMQMRVPAAPAGAGLERVRVGFVGGGNRVETIYAPVATALDDRIEICGVVTRSDEGAARITGHTGWSAATDLQTFVSEREPDLLIAALPPGVNETAYPGLVDIGVPLLLETPFCWNERSGRRLLKKIRATGRIVGVAEQFPFLPEAQLQRRLVSLGLMGQVTSVVNDFAVYDYHGIALLRALLSGGPRPRTARAERLQMTRDEAWLMGSVILDDGRLLIHRYAPGRADAAIREPGAVKLYGSMGTLLPGEARFLLTTGETMVSPIARDEDDGDLRSLRIDTPDGAVEWENPFFGSKLSEEQIAVGCLVSVMADAVRFSGNPAYPAWSALEDIELLNALNYSADRNGVPIRLPASRLTQKVFTKAQGLLSRRR